MKRLLLLVFCFHSIVYAQKLSSIEDKTKGLTKYEGYFNFYWDENAGRIWMELSRIDSEFLYVTSLPAGLGSNDIGLDRGITGEERIVKLTKTGRKILMLQPNYSFRATGSAAEKNAVEQSFAQSVLWGFTIEAETGDHYLVDATDFLMRDAMQIGNRLRSMKQGNYTADKSRSAIYLARTKNFPDNTEFETTMTFVNGDGVTGEFLEAVTPSREAITLRLHHSFVRLPDNHYKPRLFDPRSSYIPVSFYDYSTPVSEPIEKKYIIRHRLEKKDPLAARSEPVKPIIYYLDNGTPEPIRSALLEGASWWNQAFEAAGYINAFQVKILPEDADPMDVRYNMINWVHRSTRGWSYGGSVTDPRTGEIIKGNVTLGSLRVRQDYLIATGLLAPFENGVPADDKMLKMALARLRQLAAHEVGHTLGLMHNYAASVSSRASVMDYPHPTVKMKNGEIDLSDAYSTGIGEWDKVSINYGYADFPSNTNEAIALNQILKQAEAKGLLFISDQDARRAGGLHPQAHLWDNGSDAVSELQDVMKIREKALSQFGEKNIRPGMPMALLEDVLVPVYFYHRYQLEAATKLVGGMYYNYALRNDGEIITRPLPVADQRRALDAIMDCIEPAVLKIPSKIADLIPPRPAGYSFTRELFKKRTGLSFDILSPAETAVDLPFSFLFNSERLNRMQQQAVMQTGLGVSEMVSTLLQRTWKSPRKKGIEGLIQMQTEQVLLTYLLSSSVNEANAYGVMATMQQALSGLTEYIKAQEKTATDLNYKAHLAFALERMKNPSAARPTIHKEIPPGAPIGCDED